jgi:hypothetical protein
MTPRPAYYEFTEHQISQFNREIRSQRNNSANDFKKFVLETAPKLITEMGYDLDEVKIKFLTKHGFVCFGSARIPLEVITKDKRFVLKSYDVQGPQNEKEILESLKKANAEIVPEIYWLGEQGYAEEVCTGGNSLDEIARRDGIETAIRIGAEMHARLGQFGVNYSHNRWLDEFRVIGENRKIIDLGTASLYIKKGSLVSFGKKAEQFEGEGLRAILETDQDSRLWNRELLLNTPSIFLTGELFRLIEQALSIGKSSEEKWNILLGWYSAALGIAEHDYHKDGMRAIQRATWETMELMPVFLESFCEAYVR